MPIAVEILAHSLAKSKDMLLRYIEDMTPEEFLHRSTPKSNCVAWLLGHLILSDRRVMQTAFGTVDFPPLPDGFEKQFSRDEGCPQASAFGDITILVPLFGRYRDMMIDQVRAATTELLEKPLPKPHPMFGTIWEMLNFMGIHVAMHAGQITIIRRSLGRPPII